MNGRAPSNSLRDRHASSVPATTVLSRHGEAPGRAWWATVAVVCWLVFAGDLLAVETGWISGADRSLERDVHAALGHPAYAFFQGVSLVGGGEVRVALCVLILAGLIRTRRWWSSILVVAGVGGAALLDVLVKEAVRRPRPHLFPYGTSAGGFSFPSGHATDTTAFVLVCVYLLWHLTRNVRLTLAAAAMGAVFTGLVGLSRLVLGVHYPSDVIGGFALGAGWVALLLAALTPWLSQEG